MLSTVTERRRYPRVQADVLCRPAGSSLFHHKRNTKDISLGGMCVFSDQEFSVGNRLDLDVLMSEGTSVRCWAEVVWVNELEPGDGAAYEVGLKFTDLEPSDLRRLAAVLVPAP